MTGSLWNRKWEMGEVMCILITSLMYIVAYICSVVFSHSIEQNLVYMVPFSCFLFVYVYTCVTEIINKHKNNKLLYGIYTTALCNSAIILCVIFTSQISTNLCNIIIVVCCGINVVISAFLVIMAIVYAIKRVQIVISIPEIINYILIWYFPFVINSITIKM